MYSLFMLKAYVESQKQGIPYVVNSNWYEIECVLFICM
jgi:hypothetical protein